ncbi:MAG TPA: mechanosensitive ion channel family protein [Steroidobacteraceae bacterium]|nr:mechanosensitive ion channel family protein [Steroidobacteraceae bacterium]
MNIKQELQDWLDPAALSSLALSSVRVVVIALVAWLIYYIGSRLIRRFRLRLEERMTDPEQQRRAETLGRVIRYVLSVVVALVAGMLMLAEFGVSIAPILGAAGVVGLAVGFGAQSLVKDYFTGFFLLLENQIATGDVVTVADRSGLVEDVTLRYVQLRDFGGDVHFVPNNLISAVTNKSRGFSYALIEVGVAYREKLDEVFAVMRETAEQLRNDADFKHKILEPLDLAGVENWADSAVTIRCRIKVRPLDQWGVRREYLRRLKNDFDAAGIEIPFPHLTLYAGVAKDGSAPVFPIKRMDEAA